MDLKEAKDRVDNCRKDEPDKYKEAIKILAETKETETAEEVAE